jgi:hypothetical protein
MQDETGHPANLLPHRLERSMLDRWRLIPPSWTFGEGLLLPANWTPAFRSPAELERLQALRKDDSLHGHVGRRESRACQFAKGALPKATKVFPILLSFVVSSACHWKTRLASMGWNSSGRTNGLVSAAFGPDQRIVAAVQVVDDRHYSGFFDRVHRIYLNKDYPRCRDGSHGREV